MTTLLLAALEADQVQIGQLDDGVRPGHEQQRDPIAQRGVEALGDPDQAPFGGERDVVLQRCGRGHRKLHSALSLHRP